MVKNVLKKLNPLGNLLISIILIIFLGLGTLLIISSSPDYYGNINSGYYVNEIYSFERFEFEGEYIEIEAKDGILVPGYRGGLVFGLTLFGEGNYLIKTPEKVIEGTFNNLYMPFQPSDYQVLRERLILNQIRDASYIEKATRVFKEVDKDFCYIEPFNHLRTYPPSSDNVLAVFNALQKDKVNYIEANNVIYNPYSHDSIEFVSEKELSSYPSNMIMTILLIFILFIVAFLIFSIYIITLDMSKSPPKDLRCIFSAIGFIALYLIILFTAGYLSFENPMLYPNLIVSAILISISIKKKYPLSNLGLNTRYFIRTILLGVILGLIASFMGAMSLPRSLLDISHQIFLPIFVTAFALELFFRGYIQTTFEVHIGKWKSIFLTTLIYSLIFFVYQSTFVEPITQSLIFHSFITLAAKSIVLGYMYVKTRSIITGVVFTTIIEILPIILVF